MKTLNKQGSKIALGIITRGTGDDYKQLKRCFNSVVGWVDSIFVTITGPKEEVKETEAVCREFRANISYANPVWTVTKEAYKWLFNYLGYKPFSKVGEKLFLFDKARNFNFSQIPEDYTWILWLDTDDVFIDGKNLWKLIAIGDQANVDAISLDYIYRATLDKKGKIKDVLIKHLKERVVRNGVFKWVAPVHEVLVASKPTIKTVLEDCKVLHLTDSDHIKNSVDRNIKNLEFALYKSGGKDPRYIYNLAKAYCDKRTTEFSDKAFPLIQKFLWGKNQSEWAEERAQALEYLSDIYRQRGEFNNAIKSCSLALMEEPERCSIYLNIALAYTDKKDWDKALFWVHLSDKFSDKETSLNVNPRDLKVMKLSTIYTASMNKGKTYDAYDAASALIQILPGDVSVKTCYEFISKQKDQRDIATTFANLIKYLKTSGETDKILTLLGNIPDVAKTDPLLTQIKKEYII